MGREGGMVEEGRDGRKGIVGGRVVEGRWGGQGWVGWGSGGDLRGGKWAGRTPRPA